MDNNEPTTWHQNVSTVTPGLLIGGRYRLEANLGVHTQVTTWRGTDQDLSRSVLVHLTSVDDERFGWVLQAARRAAGVSDPRFLRVLDAAQASGQNPWSYVVCEYPVGDSLVDLLSRQLLTSRQAGLLVGQVTDALCAQHADGNFHQCLGPDQVVVTANGNVKISGFLIEAAANDLAQRDWSVQQKADVVGLASLLYAALTGHWPIPPSQPQRPFRGLPPAPLQGLPPATEQFWCPPTQLNPQADPGLASIALAGLRPSVGLVGPSLHSAAELADALASVVGATGAEETLERMMAGSGSSVSSLANTPDVTASDAATQVLGVGQEPTQTLATGPGEPTTPSATDPQAPTMVMAPAATQTPSQVPAHTSAPNANGPRTAVLPSVDDEESGTAHDDLFAGQSPEPPPWLSPAKPRNPGARIRIDGLPLRPVVTGIVALAVLVALVLGVKSCAGGGAESPGQSETHEQVAVAQAFVLDPVADGGDMSENMSDAPLAVDGDPATTWDTLTYYGNPSFGGLKPGVGLVLDLGKQTSVSQVSLQLTNQPNKVQIMVPSDPSTQTAPTDSVTSWSVVASDDAMGNSGVLTTSTTTRFIMVYFTQLPSIGNAQYKSGIAEVTITS